MDCDISKCNSGCPSASTCGMSQPKPKNTGSAPQKLATNEANAIKYVLAVMSGKGGVGKSSVTALLASELTRKGHKVGILDADITGPSIPKLFGVKERPSVNKAGFYPPVSKSGIKIMSVNLLLQNEDDPVIWRGPVIAGAVQQFWTEVTWGELDFLLVDLPPGTGDSPLTVMQSLPVNGIIIVSSPQDLAHMVIRKAIKMVKKLQVPILGVVENMSHFSCPHCGKDIEVFGGLPETKVYEGLPKLGEISLDPTLSKLCDEGLVEFYVSSQNAKLTENLLQEINAKNPS